MTYTYTCEQCDKTCDWVIHTAHGLLCRICFILECGDEGAATLADDLQHSYQA